MPRGFNPGVLQAGPKGYDDVAFLLRENDYKRMRGFMVFFLDHARQSFSCLDTTANSSPKGTLRGVCGVAVCGLTPRGCSAIAANCSKGMTDFEGVKNDDG